MHFSFCHRNFEKFGNKYEKYVIVEFTTNHGILIKDFQDTSCTVHIWLDLSVSSLVQYLMRFTKALYSSREKIPQGCLLIFISIFCLKLFKAYNFKRIKVCIHEVAQTICSVPNHRRSYHKGISCPWCKFIISFIYFPIHTELLILFSFKNTSFFIGQPRWLHYPYDWAVNG